MKLAELKIGQSEIHPPSYVEAVLKLVNGGHGQGSPLVLLALNPAKRAHVEAMLHDSAYQLIHNSDAAIKDKWFRVSRTVHIVLCGTLAKFEHDQRRSRA